MSIALFHALECNAGCAGLLADGTECDVSYRHPVPGRYGTNEELFRTLRQAATYAGWKAGVHWGGSVDGDSLLDFDLCPDHAKLWPPRRRDGRA